MKSIILEIINYMREHTDRELTVAELADKFGYSKFHFSREFKKLIGVTPNEYWAALKMERSLLELSRSSSILNAQLKTGYQSTGTFASTFLKTTGLTPGQYQNEIQKLGMFYIAKSQEDRAQSIFTHYSFNKKDASTLQEKVLSITCNVPENFKGIIFVGLFKKPFPTGVPIVGKALIKTTQCVIDQVPNGEYYLLACAIRDSLNPLDYFFLNHAPRDLHRTPIHFPLEKDKEISFTLREPLPTDPAILINPIKLLVDALKAQDR